MNHLAFEKTPISELPYYSKKYGIKLISKRDDLFQEGCGGNKARMLQYILADVSNNYDVLVTAGGPYSNFNRACALMCAKLGIKMHLVEYTDNYQEYDLAQNYYICKLCDIQTTRCDRASVAITIEKVLKEYEQKGIKAKFVYAGGKCLEGFYSFYDAIKEVKEQGVNFDYVFLACGTGTTLTGICAGTQAFFPHARVIAISTARTECVERPVLEEDMTILNQHLNTSYDFSNMHFYDSFLCGGYAKYNDALFDTIKECISKEGMIIDPTYSGKAFYGMTQLLASSKQFEGKTVLFWNTGGLFNLLSAE